MMPVGMPATKPTAMAPQMAPMPQGAQGQDAEAERRRRMLIQMLSQQAGAGGSPYASTVPALADLAGAIAGRFSGPSGGGMKGPAG